MDTLIRELFFIINLLDSGTLAVLGNVLVSTCSFFFTFLAALIGVLIGYRIVFKEVVATDKIKRYEDSYIFFSALAGCRDFKKEITKVFEDWHFLINNLNDLTRVAPYQILIEMDGFIVQLRRILETNKTAKSGNEFEITEKDVTNIRNKAQNLLYLLRKDMAHPIGFLPIQLSKPSFCARNFTKRYLEDLASLRKILEINEGAVIKYDSNTESNSANNE